MANGGELLSSLKVVGSGGIREKGNSLTDPLRLNIVEQRSHCRHPRSRRNLAYRDLPTVKFCVVSVTELIIDTFKPRNLTTHGMHTQP